VERPKDLYVILGVSRDASPQAIRRAYKQLVERYGPEKGGPTNPEKYEELRAAFETLSDNDRRQRYDQSLQELEAPFAWTLLQDRPPETLRRPVSPGSLTGEIILEPEEARRGGVLPVDVPLGRTCRRCEGTGGEMFDCEGCDGEGWSTRRMPLHVRIPPGVRNGAVFEVHVDDPGVRSILLTVTVHSH